LEFFARLLPFRFIDITSLFLSMECSMLSRLQKTGLFALILTGLGSFADITQAQTTVPMNLAFDGRSMTLVVPETDTSEPAQEGWRLRKYDLHIAKMFEVTHVWCEQEQSRRGLSWNYKAASGDVDMGTFYASCQRAANFTSVYGLGWIEPTVIYQDGRREFETWDIPVLDISGKKIDWWLDFVAEFRPTRRY
jgi:hypothetical protein